MYEPDSLICMYILVREVAERRRVIGSELPYAGDNGTECPISTITDYFIALLQVKKKGIGQPALSDRCKDSSTLRSQ